MRNTIDKNMLEFLRQSHRSVVYYINSRDRELTDNTLERFVYTHDNNLDCCTPGCLHYMEDGYMCGEHRRYVDCHSIKHYYCGQEELSPLINVGQYEGELPEDEALIGAVSKYIKTHENGAREIDEFRDKEDEEKLWKFISK